MRFDRRKSGVSLIGDLPWGSRFCQFYQTAGDLLDVLVPYFRAGLEGNESCLWVTSGPVGVEDAKKALKEAVPRFEEYAGKGQVEVIPYSRWKAGKGRSERAVVSMLDRAVSLGFDGLRLAFDASPGKEGGRPPAFRWADSIGRYNVVAAFTYPRDSFDALGLMEVVKEHRLALVRNAGEWEVIESSEARTAKDALKRTEEKLKSLFSNMSEGFAYHRIVLDGKGEPRDYVFLEVNGAFERLTGLKGRDVLGRRATEVLPGIEKDPTDWIGKYAKVALTGEPATFESYSGALDKWYSVSAFSPHKGFFAVTFSDITGRKLSEMTIRRLNEDLERHVKDLTAANNELEAFSYSVSHDLRAPLRHIQGFVELLSKNSGAVLDKKSARYLNTISNSATRMGELIDDLLIFSRMGRAEMRMTTVDLGSLAENVAREMRPDTEGRDVRWTVGDMPPVSGDPSMLRLVLVNLLSNALKFTATRAHPAIEFGCLPGDGNEYTFFVRDNGVGFDMRYADKLFGVFQRLHKAEEFDGTGIGLANVRRIISRHGGRTWAEGAQGVGASIYFTLPAHIEGELDERA